MNLARPMQAHTVPDLFDGVDASWPPMAHVRRGAQRLSSEGRALVATRLADTLARFAPGPSADRDALRRFFSFLSQVEVIAIEVPLSALPTARPEIVPLLERQLADEVFHSLVFASIATRLGGLEAPLPDAERVLDAIRAQEDPRTTAVLLNLIAEGWIENLFDQAVTWGVADDVFRIVLDDESRHVEEAHAHAEGLDMTSVERAVREFEARLFRLVQHPRVLLPTLALAGEERFRALSVSFLEVHHKALAEVGLAPSPDVLAMQHLLKGYNAEPAPKPTRVEPASQWRRTALEVWDTPRHPVMNGWFDTRIDHIRGNLLTAIMVAAVGKTWAEYPRMNRYTLGGEVWQPANVTVGVRVQIGGHNEAVSTVPIPNADKLSIRDIQRTMKAGVEQLENIGRDIQPPRPDADMEPLASVLRDAGLMRLIPPETVTCPVTISNVGKAGLSAGFGAMPGALGQSVEIIIGRIEKNPNGTPGATNPQTP